MSIIKNIRFIIGFILLAKRRLKSTKHYRLFQSFQANSIYYDLKRIFNISNNKYFIDWGCGNGGYTKYFAKKFKNILGIDFFIPTKDPNIKFLQADLRNLVLKKKADIIFCASVIEHIDNQKQFIRQISKNLKTGGFLYLSFPPFYSLGGGHQLKPFHYLPDKLAIYIGKKLGKISANVTAYQNMYGDWGLKKTTIGTISKILEENKLKILVCKTRFINEKSIFNTSTIPFLNDLLTWHVEFYCVNN